MSSYNIVASWDAKNGLPTGNASKRVSGAEFHTEFTAIATAVNSKADKDEETFTGTCSFYVVSTKGLVLENHLGTERGATIGGTYTIAGGTF
jgi:hypothetical protein